MLGRGEMMVYISVLIQVQRQEETNVPDRK